MYIPVYDLYIFFNSRRIVRRLQFYSYVYSSNRLRFNAIAPIPLNFYVIFYDCWNEANRRHTENSSGYKTVYRYQRSKKKKKKILSFTEMIAIFNVFLTVLKYRLNEDVRRVSLSPIVLLSSPVCCSYPGVSLSLVFLGFLLLLLWLLSVARLGVWGTIAFFLVSSKL